MSELNKIKFCVVEGRKVNKFPSRANWNDAGIDLYTPSDFEPVTLYPNEQVIIKTGLRVQVPTGCMFLVYNKSGISVKHQLSVGAGVIDETYTGEIGINIFNRGKKEFTINPDMKIAQGIIVPVLYNVPEMIEEKEYKELTSSFIRGENGFGSTGE